ncbi:MAG: Gfo/Idh/MocA family oxidoreductase [Hyphomicrobiales bacterium]|nr:Gfo/Idh/MocA family oxidoreductase [Hyphomicrobiales bacterium]
MEKRVRIGLISTSWWVDFMYLPSLTSHPSADVVGVCGRNAERAKEVAQKFGDAAVFTDFRALINAGGLDAIIIATPDDQHYDMTMAAIAAGLHVLCEKPLAGNAAQAREMYEAAEAAGVKHMVLFTWRWQPHWRYLKQLVEGGFIGRCNLAEFQFLGDYGHETAYSWRFDGARANGVTGDLGSHMIDFARWYLGEITGVIADLPTFVDRSATATPPPEPANDVGLLTLDLASGARAQILVSAISRRGDEDVRVAVTLHGEAATIEMREVFFGANAGATIRVARAGGDPLSDLEVPAEFLEGGVDRNDLLGPYAKQSAGPRAFVDAILADTVAVPGFDVGVRVQEVVDAALQSNAERRWISLADRG